MGKSLAPPRRRAGGAVPACRRRGAGCGRAAGEGLGQRTTSQAAARGPAGQARAPRRVRPRPQAFSPSLFPLFAGGDPRVNVTGPYGAPITAIASPRVAEVARAHFGCPGLAGAYLEDEGGAGSTGSHWEARLFQGELMLPSTPFAGAPRGGAPEGGRARRGCSRSVAGAVRGQLCARPPCARAFHRPAAARARRSADFQSGPRLQR